MREQILELITRNPKQYVKIISNNSELLEWVNSKSLSTSEKLSARIYSAVYQISDVCSQGNIKKFDRISTGFIGCGPANICKCTSDTIAIKVSKTKQNKSITEIHESNKKRTDTMIEKYGVQYNSQRDNIKTILSKPKIPITIHEKITNFEWMNNEYNIKKRSLTDIANELGIYYSTVGDYCQRFGFDIRVVSPRSSEEMQISRFIETLGIDIIESDRTIIGPKELDIVIPSRKFAIEVNGLRWHSYHPSCGKPENRNQHITKTTLANDSGYKLIHITDYEWNNKQEIIKSLIKTNLGLNIKIPARKCDIRMVSKTEEKTFLNEYHIQGYISSKYSYGLYFDEQLVMIITIGLSRFTSKYEFELLRMCCKSGITIVGGVSKIISKVKKDLPNTTILSYCDLSKGNGNGYEKSGFILDSVSSPGYIWTDGNNIISRYKSQTHKLKDWLATYDSSLSETKNLFSANYRRYWDCGNKVYVLYT